MPNLLSNPDYPMASRHKRCCSRMPRRQLTARRPALPQQKGKAGVRGWLPPRTSSIATAVLVLLAGVLVVGCAATTIPRQGRSATDVGLYAWVDRQLAPYLIDQLSRQPRFKGEPVLLLSMQGADVRPDIDTLTRDVRSRLLDQLLHTPGTNLYWRPTVPPWEHHRRNDRSRCSTASTARYFIGIDIAPASGGTHRVSVRALDVGAAEWVTGFGSSWQGTLTPSQQRLLADRHTDQYLRGLRVLPFIAGEVDLLAAYLANNMSCLLREQGGTAYRVFVDTRVKEEPRLQKLLTLVAHNLARDQTVQITNNEKAAELILSGSMNEIDGSLHQVWLKVRAKSADVSLASVDTDAYLYLRGPTANAVEQAGSMPLPSTLPSVRTTVLSKLRVLTGRDSDGCRNGGYEALSPLDAVERGECFWVEFDLYQPAHVLVLSHAVDGTLMRLSHSGCPSPAGSGQRLLPRHKVRIAGQRGSGFRWAGRPGIESVYAIAITDTEVAKKLAAYVHELPDGCAAKTGSIARAERYQTWLAQLDRLMVHAGGSVAWQGVRVRHAKP